jgi:phage shock protein C
MQCRAHLPIAAQGLEKHGHELLHRNPGGRVGEHKNGGNAALGQVLRGQHHRLAGSGEAAALAISVSRRSNPLTKQGVKRVGSSPGLAAGPPRTERILTMTTNLMRPRTDRMFAGVCAGLANYFGIDPIIVRIIFVVAVLSGLTPLVYLILWIVMPEEPAVTPPFRYDPYTGERMQ